MTEYVLGPDEDHETVARRLLDAAKDPASVMWSPRPNTHPHGGVYVLADEEADAIIAAVAKERQRVADRIQAAQEAAAARDAKADETGLTPEELGMSGSLGGDPGAPGTATGEAQAAGTVAEETVPSDDAEDAADEAIVDDPNTPEDEHADAENRVAKRRAARKAAASPDEQKSE